ncbi:hypothetical protein SAMN04489860_1339 [Paraoerskovia marina]|uniref:Pyridoxal phosphate homeostasis protein n=2 Tax=Paraoerskovia marina TaxID=545619 RepID=A0A1H1RHA2_9CELL|nr:hypothetical protein SAMN04489860_1339 [Paraoerskovia marina]
MMTPRGTYTRHVSSVADRLDQVHARVEGAARDAGRDPAEIRVLVATKTQDADAVREAVEAGATLIGENRVQELTVKAPELADLVAAGTLTVHLIGHLQKNKINAALGAASGIQSVDSLALARALSTRCERSGHDLDVMIQVNVSGEASKSGVAADDARQLALEVATLPYLRLTGFMTIGANTADAAVIRAGFSRLRTIRDAVHASGAPGTSEARELSMGMSRDLDLAIAEGATVVRVGTAVFGPRPTPPTSAPITGDPA